jgi:UMF1 family MFS transporter
MTDFQINNKKVINAWCSYDVANSVYNLIINTVLFPIYYQIVTKSAFNGEMVNFLGITIKNTVLYDYAIAFAYLVIIFLSPILSGIADYIGRKKVFMRFFTMLGAMSCFMLYWFDGYNLVYGILFVSLAVIGFAGSLLFYNSFLPIIATPDLHDRISARGFSWGYAGSMVLLLINIITIENYEFFGFSNKLNAMRASFLEVGIWWVAVSQIAFYYLKDRPHHNHLNIQVFSKGFKELVNVFHQVKQHATTKLFLLAFLFWSMGVQTIILVATLFGSSELGITGTKLIATIFILQLVAMAGAYIFGYVSEKKGNKFSLITMLLIWIAVCISGYFVTTDYQFYVISSLVGLVMGGIQSQSRSTYSKLIPEGIVDTASFFSFYDITEKVAVVCGMFSFGIIDHITGSMRNSTIALSLFFLIGLIILIPAKFQKNSLYVIKILGKIKNIDHFC